MFLVKFKIIECLLLIGCLIMKFWFFIVVLLFILFWIGFFVKFKIVWVKFLNFEFVFFKFIFFNNWSENIIFGILENLLLLRISFLNFIEWFGKMFVCIVVILLYFKWSFCKSFKWEKVFCLMLFILFLEKFKYIKFKLLEKWLDDR